MALTSRDETDLLLPLFDGAGEAKPFSTFMERLRRRSGATFVSLPIRLGDGEDGISLCAGPDIPARARDLGIEYKLLDRLQYDRLRPGRVYAGDEFDAHDPVRRARRTGDMRKLGLADDRVVRLLDEEALSAWLLIASERRCTAADSALLSTLAPYVAIAIRSFVVGRRQKLAEALNAEGLRRAGAGWIVFDKTARVLSLAPTTAQLLTTTFGHPPVIGQRLREFGPASERALNDAAAFFARSPDAPERTLVLSREPRLEAILTAAPLDIVPLHDSPAMVALCRQGRAPSAARAAHLARLYDLPRREAELAILLADGYALAAAGEAMGLTIETTRNYSKRLFAKMGVRGQAELVRAVYESCAVLA